MTDEASQEWPEVIYKQQTMIPVSKSVLIDPGLLEDDEPRDPRFERWGVFWWEKRRQALANALVSPLWWLGRAGDGANWLGVEATNLLYRLLRVNAVMVHDTPEEEWDD